MVTTAFWRLPKSLNKGRKEIHMRYIVYVRMSRCDCWHFNSTWDNRNAADDWAWNHAGAQFGHNNVKIEAETA